MATRDSSHSTADRPGRLGRHDILEIAGDIEDAKVAAIERSGATRDQLEAAVAWATGQSGVMGKQHKPLSGVIAEVYDILTADEALDEERD